MIELLAMTELEFQSFKAGGVKAYALERVKADGLSLETALEVAESSFVELLPEGLKSRDQFRFAICARESGLRVGSLWYALKPASS